MHKWGGCKVESVYIPSVEQPRRRWRWNPTGPILILALAVVVGIVGALVGSVAGWIYAILIFR